MGKGGGYEVLGENHQRAKSLQPPQLAPSLVEFTQPVKVLKKLHLEGLFYFVPAPFQREPLGNQGMHPVYMINSLKLVFAANRACILSTFFFPIRILEKLSWGED